MARSSEQVYIASVVGTYWCVSISMVYLNKVLMSNDAVSIPAPLFVTSYQCFVTAIVCYVAGAIGEWAQRNDAHCAASANHVEVVQGSSPLPPKPSFFAQFPKATYELSTARRILPLSVVFVGMITFNNLCLKWVEVSFYNVARSLTVVFNVFFTYWILGTPSSCRTLSCLFIVIFGFFIGGYGEMNFSVFGTLSGVLSSLFVSLNSIFTKKALPAVDDNHWRLTYYNNVNATLLFLPLVAYFERDALLAARSDRLISGPFWSAMTVAGFFGFSIGIVTVLQIKATSPLSHNMSGTAKAAAQSLLAFRVWGNEWSVLGVTGIFTVLGGSLLYTLVKTREGGEGLQAAERRRGGGHGDGGDCAIGRFGQARSVVSIVRREGEGRCLFCMVSRNEGSLSPSSSERRGAPGGPTEEDSHIFERERRMPPTPVVLPEGRDRSRAAEERREDRFMKAQGDSGGGNKE